MKKSLLVSLILLFSLFFIFSGSSCVSPETAEPALSQETAQEIDQIVEDRMAENNVPGVIVGVFIPGEEDFVKAWGQADRETGEEMNAADKVRIASITKTFTATVILQLIEEGKLSLDDTLDRFFPEIQNSESITIRQLLDMTAGIYDFVEDEGFGEIYNNEPKKIWEPQEVLDIILAHEPDFSPGEEWKYSNSNYYLLSLIIKELTGHAIADEVQQRIIEPLDLKNTSFPTTPEMEGDYSHGYLFKEDGEFEDITEFDPSVSLGGGAMISNLDDLRIWAKALYDGNLISEELKEERFKWVDGMKGVRYGLGVMEMNGLVGHNGTILGYNSVMLYDPETNAIFIVLVNKCNNDTDQAALGIVFEIIKAVYPDKVFELGPENKE